MRPIFHLSFPVADLQEAIDFYTRELGGQVGRCSSGAVAGRLDLRGSSYPSCRSVGREVACGAEQAFRRNPGLGGVGGDGRLIVPNSVGDRVTDDLV